MCCSCSAYSRIMQIRIFPRSSPLRFFIEAVCLPAIPDSETFIEVKEQVQSREKYGEALTKRVTRILLQCRLHASGSWVLLRLDKWLGMQYDSQGAPLWAGCIMLWSNPVVLSFLNVDVMHLCPSVHLPTPAPLHSLPTYPSLSLSLQPALL